jgi:acyl carrier protein
VPIGHPIPGYRAYLLDEELRPVPVGAAGELYLAGAGIARGYLGRPALTAERFVPDPFASQPGARLYRTGDRARWRPDGALEYAGRADDQLKVRGFRVEPGEIEAVLASQPGVRQAAVAPWTDPAGNVRLIAFVVPRDGHGVPGDLEAALAASLPAYMIPSEALAVPELPMTVSGKVDRRELLRRLRQAVEAGEGTGALRESRPYVALRNPVEGKLAAIWSELLGVPQVGVDDDFFALGGHSLSATQLASRVRRDLGVELPLARLFELRRLEDLAREVVTHQLAQEQGESLDALMADLENLTDEEALALLGNVDAADAAAEGEARGV